MSFDPTIRPRDHFTAQQGWLNDPNGLIRHEGEHHLFFQHHPAGLVHGPISWGHAVSPDLLTWTELPIAIAATPIAHIWSGSVVHDAANSSGLAPEGQGPLVALYTRFEPATGIQSQCLAHSVDRGLTWQPYAGNPVLDIGSTGFRDPKVFRHGDGWAMVLVLAEERIVQLYRSPDLISWTHHSSFGPEGFVTGAWECPDLVRVPVEDSADTADVLLVSVWDGGPAGGSGMQYVVGQLDDAGFRSTQDAQWVDRGADFYAAISYADGAGPEPVVQAWMSNWQYADQVPASGFRGSMTLARRLSLRRRDGELVLVQRPVVRAGEQVHALVDHDLTGTLALPVAARTCRIVADVEPGSAPVFGLRVRVGDGERTTLTIDVAARTVSLDRTASGTVDVHPAFAAVHTAPLPGGEGPVRLEVVVDVASVEVFVGDGELVLTDQVFPDPGSTGIEVFADGGTAHVHRLDVTV
ncbi:levanase/fructan beta-fructosidase [Nocardioides alpinus]|uniref:Glycosyl hydrolase family 32 n=1 Tax=Nocardioides alpinus TaxID=748909 RepID=A0A1I0VLT2_9ACTN|nr:glycoside hydrolase family 32 protein [Nocardioides alpinus]PKH37344.1 glycosyl hydrolase family 32 [Nocardioides alpinus]SFA77251.1 levanase/fructan beta-fructosidase [Nocardioides alpinus]